MLVDALAAMTRIANITRRISQRSHVRQNFVNLSRKKGYGVLSLDLPDI